MSLSTTTLPGRSQEEIFNRILNMSTEELSENLLANSLSAEGNKAAKQTRLLTAALETLANTEDQDVDISRQSEPLDERVHALEETLQEVLQQLQMVVARTAPQEPRRGGWHPPSSSITPRQAGDLPSQQTPGPDNTARSTNAVHYHGLIKFAL